MGRRIETGSESRSLYLGEPGDGNSNSRGDGYIDRLLKYIPSEVIALYLGASNVVPQSPPNQHPNQQLIAMWIVAALAAIATPVYLYITTRKKDAPTPWSQIIISSVAFPVWVYAIGGPFELSFSWYKQERWVGAIIIMFGTFLAGLYQPQASTAKAPDLPLVAQ
jgi:hypothetical protein